MLLVTSVRSQSTHTLNNRTGTDFLGFSSGTGGALDIRNDFNDVINFKTNTNLHAILDANGNFKIGQTNATNYFGIGSDKILWHNGNLQDIFVGVGAGNGSMSGRANSCIGNSAGIAITSGDSLTFVGYEAGIANTSGRFNTAVGCLALHSVTDNGMNVAVGYKALYTVNTLCGGCLGGENVAVGYRALESSDAYGGCALGFEAAVANTVGCSIVAIGEEALHGNTEGNENVAVGHDALLNNTTLSGNVAIGTSALQTQYYASATSCLPSYGCINSYNVAVGKYALFSNNPTTDNNGVNNTAIGTSAGGANTEGYGNTFVGFLAGNANNTGYNNTFLGFQADAASSGLFNATAIGANANVVTDNTVILGDRDANVGIGLSAVAGGPLARLHVLRAMTGTASGPIGAKIVNNDIDAGGFYIGAAYGLTIATDGNNLRNFGGFYRAENATTNKAGYFDASGISSGSGNNTNLAIDCDAGNAIINFGVRAIASSGFATTNNYGVHSHAILQPGVKFNVAVYGEAVVNGYPPPPYVPAVNVGTWAGYFKGDLGYTGTFYAVSDSTMKTDIQPINSDTATSILNQLNTYTYYFDTLQLQGITNLSHEKQFGFMAQQIESVAPNLVLNTILPAVLDSAGNIVTPERDVKMYNPMGIIPLLVQANKSLSSKDALLEERVAALEQIVNSCCSPGNRNPGSSSQNTGSIELENLKSMQLDQNDPNPFTENTIIHWTIPTDFKEANILFYDNTGNQINKFKIEQKGNGELQVFGSKLSAGIYNYSLIVDSKLIDSKKMLKAK